MRSYIQFLRQDWPLLAFGFLCIFFGNFGQSFFVGVYGDSIRVDLDLSATAYGSLYSLATLASGTTIMFVGGWLDRGALMRFTFFVAVGLSFAAIAFYFSVSSLLVLLSFYLVRLFGQGLLPHIGVTTMARYFDQHRGKALSIASSGVPVGEIILPAAAVLLIGWLGWRESWLVIGFIIPVVFLPLSLFLITRPSAQRRRTAMDTGQLNIAVGKHTQGARRMLLRDKRFWFFLPALLTPPFVVTGLFIHQGFVIEAKGWTLEWFAECFIVYGVVHWVASLLAGWLVDRFSASALLALYTLPVAAAMVVLATVSGMDSALWVLSLIALSIGFAGPIGGALWAEVYGPERIASIRSLVFSLVIWSTSASPILLGWCIDQHLSLQAIAWWTATLSLFFAAATRFSYKMAASQDRR